MITLSDPKVFTPETGAPRLGCKPWHIRALFDRGVLKGSRLGSYRVFTEADLPLIEAALRQVGYLA